MISLPSFINSIQWIHTDYKNWIHTTEWGKEITKEDGKIYRDFDVIVLLTERIKIGFLHIQIKVQINLLLLPLEKDFPYFLS